MTTALGTKAATVSHDGIEYDLYDDDGRLWSVALAGSSVDLIDVIKPIVLGALEIILWTALEKQSKQLRNEQLEDIAEDRRAYA
jgi:hypothetical protein